MVPQRLEKNNKKTDSVKVTSGVEWRMGCFWCFFPGCRVFFAFFWFILCWDVSWEIIAGSHHPFFCRVPFLKLCVQWKLLSRHRQNDQQGHPTAQPALGQSTSQRVLEWSAFRSSKWPHEKCTSSVFEKRKDSSGMGAWGNIHPSTQMSAQQKLTSTWNCVFWADLRLPLSGRQMSSLSLSVSTFHQTSSKNLSNLSPLTSEFPGLVPVASENDLEDTKTIHLDAATVATICYLHPSKSFFGSQTWDSKPPHRREVDRWVARTQKELPRESLATSLVKCWKTTREFERRECWAKSLRSAQAAWQNEEGTCCKPRQNAKWQ